MPTLIKDFVKRLIGSGIGVRISANWHNRNDKALILNMHRVMDYDLSLWKPVESRVFIASLKYLKKHYNLLSILDRTKGNKPSAILSFDDGFLDFYKTVVPILNDLQIPVNHNIIPRCVETQLPVINVIIQDFAGRAKEKEIKSIDWGFRLHNGESVRNQLSKFSQELRNKPFSTQLQVESQLLPQIKAITDFEFTKMMSLIEILELKPYVDLGNHSYSHATMGIETSEFFLKDFQESQAWFQEKLNIHTKIYAFPNGSSNSEQVNFLEERGIEHILLVGNQSSSRNSRVRNRVNFSPCSLIEAKFDSVRPLLGAFS